MSEDRDGRRGLRIFRSATAPDMHGTTMQRPPAMDDAAAAAMPEFGTGRGSVAKLLFGDPDAPDDGGMSLVRARFGADYHLPRHSHSVPCLYYVLAGEIRMGSQVIGPGDGFFVDADAPYGYRAGPEGVEVLEFPPRSAYDSKVHEPGTGWAQILETVRSKRDAWAEELAPYR